MCVCVCMYIYTYKRVPKKVVLFMVYLGIILTLFIFSTLFDKDYTRISYIYMYVYVYIHICTYISV